MIRQSLLWTYLQHAFQQLETEFLTSLKESIEQLPASKDRDDLLRNITSRPQTSNSAVLTKRKVAWSWLLISGVNVCKILFKKLSLPIPCTGWTTMMGCWWLISAGVVSKKCRLDSNSESIFLCSLMILLTYFCQTPTLLYCFRI